jgi:hypothetical protein
VSECALTADPSALTLVKAEVYRVPRGLGGGRSDDCQLRQHPKRQPTLNDPRKLKAAFVPKGQISPETILKRFWEEHGMEVPTVAIPTVLTDCRRARADDETWNLLFAR